MRSLDFLWLEDGGPGRSQLSPSAPEGLYPDDSSKHYVSLGPLSSFPGLGRRFV